MVVSGRRVEIIGASVMNGYGALGPTMGCTDLTRVRTPLSCGRTHHSNLHELLRVKLDTI